MVFWNKEFLILSSQIKNKMEKIFSVVKEYIP